MISWDCCRMCLNKNTLNPISSGNQQKYYLEKIYIVTGVKISLNDQLPKHICKECTKCIDNFLKYREKCQETQKIINHIIKNELKSKTTNVNTQNQCNNNGVDDKYQKIDSLKRKKESTEPNNDSLTTNLENFDEPQSFTDENTSIQDDELNFFDLTDICPNDTNSRQNDELNFVELTDITETINNKRPKLVERKEKLEPKNKLLKTPLENELNEIIENDQSLVDCENETDSKKTEEFKCKFCDLVLTTKKAWYRHNSIHRTLNLVCEHCGMIFKRKRNILVHYKAKHGYEKTDKCSFCDYRGCNSEQVKIHERKHTGERPYVCKDCNASFYRSTSYTQHVAIHLPEKTVQCKQCPSRFKSVTLMRIHANRHRTDSLFRYLCYICQNRFVRRRNVLRHLRRIHSVTDLTQPIERVAK